MAITSNETLHRSYESHHKVFNPLKIFKSVANRKHLKKRLNMLTLENRLCMTFFLQQRSYRYLVTLININCKALSRGRSIRPLL